MNAAALHDPSDLRRAVVFDDRQRQNPAELLRQEWLVTNGLGGYASGTVAAVITRRYHGLLVAALPAPLGRFVMISQLAERVRLGNDRVFMLHGEEHEDGSIHADGASHLQEFRLVGGLPVWIYDVGGCTLEKRLLLPRFQNTVHVSYRVLRASGRVRLGLRPFVVARPHEAPVDHHVPPNAWVVARDQLIEVHLGEALPALRMHLAAAHGAFTVEPQAIQHLIYRLERTRGYQFRGDAWIPGYFRTDLEPGEAATFIASTEPATTMLALSPDAAMEAEMERRRRLLIAASPVVSDSPAAELVLAADQFIIAPAGRVEDNARARAAGEEARTVIAGYHWFTDWGRDTMISLEGLTLVTGRASEARNILRTFASHVRDGLIPNLFPEGDKEGLYHTADATLWFFHALDRYDTITGDHALVAHLLPVLEEIVALHVRGTRFNIGVDPADGLITQGAEGYQLTWMDAKVDDWVVTPRRGKPVEINALWYNALELLASWQDRMHRREQADDLRALGAQVRERFNARFWNPATGHLFDVVDGPSGPDAACRPNQILAMSLTHPVLEPTRWKAVLEVVQQRLLTPVGLRSLDPTHPDFKPQYYGDLRARDAAYHQGTVWAWLIGPFVDAWLRVHQAPGDARPFLEGFLPHLSDGCIGSINEIFDATPPFTPRGCIAQAWSVAEVLRSWLRTASPSEQAAAREHDARPAAR